MYNIVNDLACFSRLGVSGLSSKAPQIIQVNWSLPLPRWIKCNIDGAANDYLGIGGCGGVFAAVMVVLKVALQVHWVLFMTFKLSYRRL